jgi:hypothetical protein
MYVFLYVCMCARARMYTMVYLLEKGGGVSVQGAAKLISYVTENSLSAVNKF